MRNNRSVHHFFRYIAPACLAAGLIFAVTQADAYYYGYGGYGGYGGSYYGGRYGGYGGSHYGGYRYYGYRGGYSRGYRSGRYYGGYPYRRYSHGGAYSGYSYPRPRAPGNAGASNGVTNPVPQPNGNASRASVSNGGWTRLADGQYTAAIAIFAKVVTSEPKSGRPKVGYALSAAAFGDLRRGVWAMRRAFAIDPDSIHYVTIGESLRPRIVQLIARYRTDRRSGDAAFMRASLHYLLGDATAARGQADLAVAAGDRRPSTVNLVRLIDKEIDAQPWHDVEGD